MKKNNTFHNTRSTSSHDYARLMESQMEPVPTMPDFYVGSWFHSIVSEWEWGAIDEAEYFGLAEFLNEEPTPQFLIGHILWDYTGHNEKLIPAICAYVGQVVWDLNEDDPAEKEEWQVCFPPREDVLAAMANLM